MESAVGSGRSKCLSLWTNRIYRLEFLQNWWCSEQTGLHKECWAHPCNTACTRSSSSWALTHILVWAVPDQIRPNVAAGVPIHKKDGYTQWKNEQKVLRGKNKIMATELQLCTLQSSQTVLDMTSLPKRLMTGQIKNVGSGRCWTQLLLASFTSELCSPILLTHQV
jgi:hypothetical protein